MEADLKIIATMGRMLHMQLLNEKRFTPFVLRSNRTLRSSLPKSPKVWSTRFHADASAGNLIVPSCDLLSAHQIIKLARYLVAYFHFNLGVIGK
jgi:hypothetical protein